MGARFLILATTGESSGRAWTIFGPMMMLLILVLVVLAVAIAVLARFARNRLTDGSGSRKKDESPDPWVEAGRRIAQPPDRRRSGHPPESPDPDIDPTDPDEDAGAAP